MLARIDYRFLSDQIQLIDIQLVQQLA